MKRFVEQLAWIDGQRPAMTALLKEWVGINSGTENAEGVRAMGRRAVLEFERLGGTVRALTLGPRRVVNDRGEVEEREVGPAFLVRSAAREGAARGGRVLLGIHTDTVFGAGHRFQMAEELAGGILRGPGSCDAKGGIVVMLFALLALERSGFAKEVSWEVFLNPDEEVGSPASAGMLEEAAGRHDAGLVFEPALPDGFLVGSRKGSGNYTFVVRGRAAHAGRDSHLGRNAIHALATFVAGLAASAGDYPGIVINTGWIGGGGAVNVVPDLAVCRVNVRAETTAQQQAFERDLAVRVAAVSGDGILLERYGGFGAPPKPLTPAMESMLQQFKDCATEIGVTLGWRATGGACDGNRLAAAGLPTVDSLGVRGGNMHTEEEFAVLESLAERAKLTALFLMRVGAGEIVLPRREFGKLEVPA